MESEKGWAVWSPALRGILPHTIAFQEETAINRAIHGGNWKDYLGCGYRTIEVTISYEKPQASDEEE